jgi:FkbM family methyltransferase
MSRERAQELLTSHFGHFGPLNLPYHKMGNIDSLDLFGPTELMIFALYWHNRKRWRHALDIGANIGLHSILMAKLGWGVLAFEPDPEHFRVLAANLMNNEVTDRVRPHPKAVHTTKGMFKFIRVLNNLTGNHIAGYKQSYGPREEITVETEDCRVLWPRADFVKIDCEGNEAELVKTLTAHDMSHLDMVMEIRNLEAAQQIFYHFKDLGVPMWSQKIDWNRVTEVDQMPRVNREGSLFVGHKGPWI